METVFMKPDNTGPPIEQVWAFISRDQEGRENVLGSLIGDIGTPFITGNPRTFEIHKRYARVMLKQLPPGKSIHLLRFSHREEIFGWESD